MKRTNPIKWTPALAVAAVMGCTTGAAQSPEVNPLHLAPHHITASVGDIEKESQWYQRVLGFRELNREKINPNFEVRQLGIPGYRVDLRWQTGTIRHKPEGVEPSQGWFHVVFMTPNIDAAYQKLTDEKTDVKAFRNDKSAIVRMIVHDPEGNEVEIVPQ